MTVGVLALQGDFAAHAALLRRLGAEVREVRVPADLAGLDGLVIPGGESTTMTLGVEREGLGEPLRAFVRGGGAVLGTCAGLIMADRDHLGLMDIRAQRNAFGRQVRSFEADLDIAGVPGGPVRAVFIRAPWIADAGEGDGNQDVEQVFHPANLGVRSRPRHTPGEPGRTAFHEHAH